MSAPTWMTIRDCCCDGGRIESDYAPGTFYPCASCNPAWSRVPFDQTGLSNPDRQAERRGRAL